MSEADENLTNKIVGEHVLPCNISVNYAGDFIVNMLTCLILGLEVGIGETQKHLVGLNS